MLNCVKEAGPQLFSLKKKETAACAFVLLWRGRPRKRNFQADEVQIEEKTQASSFSFLFFLSSSARKSEMQKFLSCYGTRT